MTCSKNFNQRTATILYMMMMMMMMMPTLIQMRLSYVYWTMHHLDSSIKRDQLDVTCFIISLFNAQHVSDVLTSILRSLRLIC